MPGSLIFGKAKFLKKRQKTVLFSAAWGKDSFADTLVFG